MGPPRDPFLVAAQTREIVDRQVGTRHVRGREESCCASEHSGLKALQQQRLESVADSKFKQPFSHAR